MRTLQTAFWMCCSLSFTQPLQAAPGGGYVIQWGTDSAANGASSAKVVASNAVAVSAGASHSLALTTNGTVYGWGWNRYGQATGIPATNPPDRSDGEVIIGGQVLSNVVSIVAVRNFSLALKKDGTVVTWGENAVPRGLTNIVAIAGDLGSSWVLKRDGTVVGWTSQLSGQGYGQMLSADHLSNVVAIAVGPNAHGTRGIALSRDSTVGHWGSETDHKDATPPEGLSNVVAVAAGASHSLALKSDGTVVGWGWNKAGEATGVPTTNAPNLAYFSSGQVRIGGQILSNVVSIAAGRGYSLALKKDGTVVKWGNPPFRKMVIPAGLSNVVAIATGAEDFCLAITTNSDVAARFRASAITETNESR